MSFTEKSPVELHGVMCTLHIVRMSSFETIAVVAAVYLALFAAHRVSR